MSTPPPPPPPPPGSTPPPPPGAPTSTSSLDVSSADLIQSAVCGAAAYVVAWVVAFAGTLLAMVAATIDDADASWSLVATGPGQLVAMSFRSPLTVDGSGVTFIPIVVLATILVAVAVLSGREPSRPDASMAATFVRCATTAVTFVVVAFLVAIVARADFSGESASAARAELVVFGLVAVGVASFVGRRRDLVLAAWKKLPAEAGDAVRAVSVHLLVMSAVSAVVVAVWLVVDGEAAFLLALPLAIGNVAVAAITFGHFGGYEMAFGIGGFDHASSSDLVWVFSRDTPAWVWASVVLAIVSTLLASVVLHVRAGRAPRARVAGAWVVGAYAVAGIAVVLLGTMTFGGGGSSGRMGPALWFVLVMAVWGLLTDAAARTVAAPIARALPDSAVALAAGPLTDRRASLPADEVPLPPATRRILILGGGVIALVLGAVVVVGIVNSAMFSAESAAIAFVEDADSDELIKAIGNERRLDDALLDQDVLDTLGGEISDIEVTDVNTLGELTRVKLEYEMSGTSTKREITLRQDGSRALVFDQWEVVNGGLGRLTLSMPSATDLKVNGETVDIDSARPSATYAVVPGTYELEPQADSSLLEFETKTVTVDSNRFESERFEIRATDELETKVTEKVNEALDACLARTEASPVGCPNRTYGRDLTDIKWKLEERPTYQLRLSGYTADVRILGQGGRATVTAKQAGLLPDDEPTDYKRDVRLYVYGRATLNGDDVTVRLSY